MRIDLGYKFVLGVFAVIAAVMAGFYLTAQYQLPQLFPIGIAVLVGLSIGLTFSRTYSTLFSRLQAQTEAISQGDLAGKVTLGNRMFTDELDDMALAVDEMRESLQELAAHIRSTSNEVATAADKLSGDAANVDRRIEGIATTMGQMSRAATQQNSLVEKVVERLNEMATTLQDTAFRARDAADAATKTNETAKAGGRVTDRAVGHMNTIFEKMERSQSLLLNFSERTREINKIVEVINGIAQKTNILALNATIEAVRAGDAGRGFAVVAEEIRKLAESTAHSAEAIMDLVRGIEAESARVIETIQESGANINESRESINDIGENLSAIIALANETVAKVNEIHRTAQSQVRRGDEVMGVMNEIARVTGDNHTATLSVSQTAGEQTKLTFGMSKQAEELARLAETLRSVAFRFKLG